MSKHLVSVGLTVAVLASLVGAQTPESLRLRAPVHRTTENKQGVVTYKPFKQNKGTFDVTVCLYEFDGLTFVPIEESPAVPWNETLTFVIDKQGDQAAGEPVQTQPVNGFVDLVLGDSKDLPDDLYLREAWFTTKVSVTKKNGTVTEFAESPFVPLGVAGATGGQSINPKDVSVGGLPVIDENGVWVGLGGTGGPPGPTGASGATGPQGPAGATGPTGPSGAAGPTGPQGVPGAPGVPGADGNDGTDGADGAPGAAGPTGPSGAAGTDGAPGAAGPTGPSGAAGTDGAPGAAGPTGPTGAAGADGAPGAAGPTGPSGAVGTDGAPGAAGPTGPSGATGPTGAAGADGVPGAAGSTGPQGPTGADGAPGAAGPTGNDGAPGAPGATGPAGSTGSAGPTGPQGTAGANGADGATGATGPAGADGAAGPTGPAGADGADGATGLMGAPGAPGLPGATGPAGAAGAPGPTGSAGGPGPVGPTGPTGPLFTGGAVTELTATVGDVIVQDGTLQARDGDSTATAPLGITGLGAGDIYAFDDIHVGDDILMGPNGMIGVGETNPNSLIDVVDNAVGPAQAIETVSISRANDVQSGHDLLSLRSTSGSPADFQYIEAVRGTNNVVFSVGGAGQVLADGPFTGPADFAEMIRVTTGGRSVEAGDVLVIDPERPRAVVASQSARSTLVAGVYSTKPGYLGSETSWDRVDTAADGTTTIRGNYSPDEMTDLYNEVPVAVVGIVPCKVSAENGAIRPGDLLVTSTIPGHAMRDQDPRSGTIVGKALGSLDEGTGVIRILVTLH